MSSIANYSSLKRSTELLQNSAKDNTYSNLNIESSKDRGYFGKLSIKEISGFIFSTERAPRSKMDNSKSVGTGLIIVTSQLNNETI